MDLKFKVYLKERGILLDAVELLIGKSVKVDLCGSIEEYKLEDIELLPYIGLKDIDSNELYVGDVVDLYNKKGKFKLRLYISYNTLGKYDGVHVKNSVSAHFGHWLSGGNYIKKVGNILTNKHLKEKSEIYLYTHDGDCIVY